MQLLSCNFNPFYAVNDGAGSGAGNIAITNLDDKTLNKEDLYTALGEDTDDVIPLDDDKKTPPKEPKKKEEDVEEQSDDEDDDAKEDDEDDELKDIEEELEGPKEEQLELVTPVRRKEILAKYPKLFQDFPYLERAYYREQQFTEIYPTIDDAKVANEKATNLDRFEREIMGGNTESVLKAVKSENENAFHQVVDNYMQALYNTDQQAYYHVIGNINKFTIQQMVTEGRKLNNEPLQQAAAILQQFIFGSADWTPPSRLSKNQNPESQQINNERTQFAQERYNIARTDLVTRLENVLTSTIEQNIDKQGSMTTYVKKAACSDAMQTLQKLINKDGRFQSLQGKLWEAAASDNFSKASMDRIKSAFTTKARQLLPTVLKKARTEALKGLSSRAKDESLDVNDGTTRRPKEARNTTSSSSSGRSYKEKAQQIPQGMSTYDFLTKD